MVHYYYTVREGWGVLWVEKKCAADPSGMKSAVTREGASAMAMVPSARNVFMLFVRLDYRGKEKYSRLWGLSLRIQYADDHSCPLDCGLICTISGL